MPGALLWGDDGAHWPHRTHSQFLQVSGQHWHVQSWPPPRPGAPTWLLLHGTGASTHSWRGLAPLLAPHVGLVAPDLPGHGFSGPAPIGRAGMEGMAQAVRMLLRELGQAPAATVGHSAGAAIAVRWRLREDAGSSPAPAHTLFGLNAALLPLQGLAGTLFSPAAKLLALNPLAPHFFSWHATQGRMLARLLGSTGSTLDAEGAALYRRLIESPAHVAGALAMMAQWDLPALARDLPALRTMLHMVVGEADGTIPPGDAARVQRLQPSAQVHRLPGLGHLAHEEAPARLAALLLRLGGLQAPGAASPHPAPGGP
ncbi:alpha/beta fold hydrolase BchO [Rubrivivax rivuli]|uniref:Alpha/beta fold hydrolase n=1 Tax=Rubrivivax rivuli TaxID=1862385 RepID=A0A437RKE1_9BURK|nr:alpha/beta fold hydrolase BchO [Rubrivivax rivuli]RVU47237.1 alpha/beta fold hydrolase [Rubrivivax rivuli]